MAEVLALRDGILLASSLSLDRIILESDNLEAVERNHPCLCKLVERKFKGEISEPFWRIFGKQNNNLNFVDLPGLHDRGIN